MGAIADLQKEVQQLPSFSEHPSISSDFFDFQEEARAAALSVASMHTRGTVQFSDAEDSSGLEAAELRVELTDVRKRCDALQQTVDQQVMVSVWQIERQLPETVEKLARFQEEYVERMTQLHEHDVRVSLALSRLGTHEERVQSCMARLERLPSLAQVRTLCFEELGRRLGETGLEGLGTAIQIHDSAIVELRGKLQEICDCLAFGGRAEEPLATS